MVNKILIIGLDGVTFDIIDPLIRKGQLPNIASLIQHGVSAPLTSTIPPNTAVAWTSMTTGVNPGKHGIFYFTESPHKNYGDGNILNDTNVHFKRLWSILSKVGKKSIVVGVPFTYPPSEINGIIITGEKDKEKMKAIATYPPEFADELVRRFKRDFEREPPLKTLFSVIPQEELLDRSIKSMRKQIELIHNVIKYLIKEQKWDFFMGCFLSPDHVQHHFWKYMDTNHVCYDPNFNPKYKTTIYEIYQQIDTAIGQILAHVGDKTTVVLASDHGGGPIHNYLLLNMWLEREGYLKRRRVGTKFQICFPTLYKCLTKLGLNVVGNRLPRNLRNIKIPMVKKAQLTPTELIDWTNTKAYATYWGISINMVNREPYGIVHHDDYEKLIEEITKKLYELKDPYTGKKIVQKVVRKEILYHGVYVEKSTDFVVIPDPLYGVRRTFHKKGPLSKIDDTEIISGNHRQEGIFIIKGPYIKKGIKLEKGMAEIIDVTPTVLYLMGAPILSQMDGKVLKEVIEDRFLNENPVVISEEDGYITPPEFKLSAEEEAKTKEQLKALGYLD